MKLYKNGDVCPCCGRIIQGMSEKELEMMSMLFDMLGLAPKDEEAEP